jgi:ADP-ribose diphosphatase
MSEALPDLKQSELVYKGRVFNITVDRVRYSDGREVKMECVRHPGSVVLLPMPAPDRVVLVRQYRYVVDRWLWEPAARRECHEEIGRIAGTAQKLLSLFPSPGFSDEEMHFFLLTDLRDRRPDEPEAHQDPDEILNVKEFSVHDIREMVKSGEIADMKTAVGITLV